MSGGAPGRGNVWAHGSYPIHSYGYPRKLHPTEVTIWLKIDRFDLSCGRLSSGVLLQSCKTQILCSSKRNECKALHRSRFTRSTECYTHARNTPVLKESLPINRRWMVRSLRLSLKSTQKKTPSAGIPMLPHFYPSWRQTGAKFKIVFVKSDLRRTFFRLTVWAVRPLWNASTFDMSE